MVEDPSSSLVPTGHGSSLIGDVSDCLLFCSALANGALVFGLPNTDGFPNRPGAPLVVVVAMPSD